MPFELAMALPWVGVAALWVLVETLPVVRGDGGGGGIEGWGGSTPTRLKRLAPP